MKHAKKRTKGVVFSLAMLPLMLSPIGADAAPSPLDRVKNSVVIVSAQGVSQSKGNSGVESQATGFFISRFGYLVTSYHLLTLLGDADRDSIKIEIQRTRFDNRIPVSNKPLYSNEALDLLVLFSPVADPDLAVLEQQPQAIQSISLATTPVYAAGFPDGYSYVMAPGFVTSFIGSLNPPIPVWTTNIPFKKGHSGGPVVLADGRVVGIVKGVDEDAESMGFIVPVNPIPREMWDQRLVLTSPNDTGRLPGPRIVISETVPPQRREVTKTFTLDSTCGSELPSTNIAATEGWRIDPVSIKLETVNVVKAPNQTELTPRIVNERPEGFAIELVGGRTGCVRIPMPFGNARTTLWRISLHGAVSYTEIPVVTPPESRTVIDSVASHGLALPLPNQSTPLTFTLEAADGRHVAFTPQPGEISQRVGDRTLDVGKVLGRLNF